MKTAMKHFVFKINSKPNWVWSILIKYDTYIRNIISKLIKTIPITCLEESFQIKYNCKQLQLLFVYMLYRGDKDGFRQH